MKFVERRLRCDRCSIERVDRFDSTGTQSARTYSMNGRSSVCRDDGHQWRVVALLADPPLPADEIDFDEYRADLIDFMAYRAKLLARKEPQ